MSEKFRKMAETQGIRVQIIPIEYLKEIKNELQSLRDIEDLNRYQNWILDERYVLNSPDTGFEIHSIIVAVCKYDLTKASFVYRGKKAEDILEHTGTDMTEILEKIAREGGFHLKSVYWLPQKRLAVQSGLCEYGKNNICYAESFGSFLKIATFFSDILPYECVWRNVKNMDICNHCGICQKNCPTGAILPDRFLIDNEKCMTKEVEWGTEPLPAWIPKAELNHLTGCLKCQLVCPANRERFAQMTETVEFNEQETKSLLSALTMQDLPEELWKKLQFYNLDWCIKSIPRNLKNLLYKADQCKLTRDAFFIIDRNG